MLFNSISFAVFMTVVFFVYWLLPHKLRMPLLLAASYYFYMSWSPKYVVLILFTTAVSYFSALALEKTDSTKKKKAVLGAALVLCLGVLFFFKYFNYTSNLVSDIANRISIPLQPITLKVMLPVGISFYTFQTLSYVIDVYRGRARAEHNFLLYATFVSFFPQLVAGPIERTENLLPQLKAEQHFDYDKITYGLKLMAWGFFKKLAIADVLAKYVDITYMNIGRMAGIDYVFAILFFTLQIYCDFSGYSDIAIGAARLLGIELMTNFRSPYFSKSIKEFWSRWHISLSTWFRDYVYIPLGGNRCSRLRNDFNLLLTFLVSGIWHGAGITYVVWGGIHGVLQVIEKHIRIPEPKGRHSKRLYNVFFTLLIFGICSIAWVFFRADSLHDAISVIRLCFVGLSSPMKYINPVVLDVDSFIKIVLAVALLTVFDYFSLRTDVIRWVSERKTAVRWIIYVLLIVFTIMCIPVNNQTAFIYFQF